jgi:hypothetical protein
MYDIKERAIYGEAIFAHQDWFGKESEKNKRMESRQTLKVTTSTHTGYVILQFCYIIFALSTKYLYIQQKCAFIVFRKISS